MCPKGVSAASSRGVNSFRYNQPPMNETQSQPAAEKPVRRWYQYSLRTLLLLPLLLALVLSAIYSWPYVHRRYILWRLQDYVDKDLRKVKGEERQRVARWIAKLLGQEPVEAQGIVVDLGWLYENWLLHSANTPGDGRQTYVIQTEPAVRGPAYCTLHKLDSSGRLVHSTRFNLGLFASPLSGTFSESRYGFPCLVMETDFFTDAGRPKSRQFYAITDEYVEIVRAEDIDGRFAKANLKWAEIHVKPPDWSDWQRLLESPDRLQQLRGLAAYWTLSESQRHQSTDDKVRRRLEQLARSPDPWISEEANQALAEAQVK